MEVREFLITVEQATKWLEGNVHNRVLRESVVAKYARDMKNGRWLLSHQAIAFDGHGTLLDGQHRLWAVIESKTPTRFLVARGCDPHTLAVIDGMERRTAVDHLRLGHNMTVSSTEVAIARRLMPGLVNSSISTAEVLQALTKHRDAITTAVKAFPKQVRNVTIVPVMTVIARAFYHTESNKSGVLHRVGEVLAEGRIEKGEEALLLLRNWLLTKAPTSVKGRGNGYATLVYQKTERAVYAFLNHQVIGQLYSATQELFPLPGERLTVTRLQQKTVVVAAKTKKTKLPKKGKAVEAAKKNAA